MKTDDTELSLANLELDKLVAFVQLMYLAAYSDGAVTNAERARFEDEIVAASQGALRPEVVSALVEHVGVPTETEDRADRLRLIRHKLTEPRLRRAALELAARITLADGYLAIDERVFLDRVATALELEPGEVDLALELAVSTLGVRPSA